MQILLTIMGRVAAYRDNIFFLFNNGIGAIRHHAAVDYLRPSNRCCLSFDPWRCHRYLIGCGIFCFAS